MNKIMLSDKCGHICAFCEHWYDITNQYISPIDSKMNLWSYDRNAECKCFKKNMKRKAFMTCSHFIIKVPLS